MLPVIPWDLISFELFICLTIVILVVVDIFFALDRNKDWLGTISFISLFGLIGIWLKDFGLTADGFSGMLTVDSLSWFFKGFFLLTMLFVFVMAQEFFKKTFERRNEFYLLLWTAFLGMCLISSSADFLLLFISIEILTISLYIMTAYLKTDKHSIEAGMKYLILGSLASGALLYGICLLYGVTHSTNFQTIKEFAGTNPMNPMIILSLVLIFSGVGFKIASVPFHMWVPDVYQGAPTPVTALLSVGSKAAGIIVLIRLFFGILQPWHGEWSAVFAALSAVTMTYGNLGAIFQTNIKRLLGYSSISHAGYLMMGLAAGTALGASAINFYLMGYLFANLAAFLVIVLMFMSTNSDEINSYTGLSKRSGILACTLAFALVSLAGMPPLAGFFGKFTLLVATIKSGFLWLAIVAAVNIVISLYYYLMVVKKIYIDAPQDPSPIAIPSPMRIILIFAVLVILAIGIFQGPFLEAATMAISQMRF